MDTLWGSAISTDGKSSGSRCTKWQIVLRNMRVEWGVILIVMGGNKLFGRGTETNLRGGGNCTSVQS